MEVISGADEGFVREWTPCSHILNLIPPRIQTGIFSSELCLTCVDAVSEYIALGTNVGLVYWYDRKKGNIQRLRCEASTSPITYVKIVSTVDFMVGAGNAAGQVTVFQIPREHPENVPDVFKPKVEPKVERYTIGDLHKSMITAIEWSKNGMRLFSGDKDGVIIMTEIDFYMHLCKSLEMVNEGHEIVQLSYCQGALLVSSVYRSIVCERRDARWQISQLGRKERRSLCALGAVFQYSYARGGPAAVFCARPGLRLWRADRAGQVLQTLLFKDAISNPLTVAELLNPSQKKHSLAEGELNFGPLYVFREHFLVSHNDQLLYILDPRSLTAVAVVDDLRRILSVSVNKEEIFVLEGPRSLVRLAHAPEPAALAPEDPTSAMSKSLSSSLQQAVSTVRELAQLGHAAPYLASVLEHPIAVLTRNETLDPEPVSKAEECFELPPVVALGAPERAVRGDVLQSIVADFRTAPDAPPHRALEMQRKLKMYDSIMGRRLDEELIHSSRRSRRREGPGTPRREASSDSHRREACTPREASVDSQKREASEEPSRESVSYTTPCVMEVSLYDNSTVESDDLLEQQIEEKEKILAKMLNLESLSIKSPTPPSPASNPIPPPFPHYEPTPLPDTPLNKNQTAPHKIQKVPTKPIAGKNTDILNVADLVPKVVQLPNNWNLENIELRLDMRNGVKNGFNNIISPDDNLDGEWEVI